MMVEQKLKSVADELGKGTPDAVAREVIFFAAKQHRSGTRRGAYHAGNRFFRDNRSFMALKEAVLPSSD